MAVYYVASKLSFVACKARCISDRRRRKYLSEKLELDHDEDSNCASNEVSIEIEWVEAFHTRYQTLMRPEHVLRPIKLFFKPTSILLNGQPAGIDANALSSISLFNSLGHLFLWNLLLCLKAGTS